MTMAEARSPAAAARVGAGSAPRVDRGGAWPVTGVADRPEQPVLPDTRAGDRWLDVGCGRGEGVRALARLVGPGGRVVGLDCSPAAIAEAVRSTAGLGATVEYRVSDPRDLPFGDCVFDGCRSEGLFERLDDPEPALREMVRVGRPGAHVVVAEVDWATLSVEAADERITDRLRQFLGGRVRGGSTAGRLAELLRGCGLRDVTATPILARASEFRLAADPLGLRDALERAQTAGAVSAVEAATWLDEVEWASRRGRFTGSLVRVIVAGRRG